MSLATEVTKLSQAARQELKALETRATQAEQTLLRVPNTVVQMLLRIWMPVTAIGGACLVIGGVIGALVS